MPRTPRPLSIRLFRCGQWWQLDIRRRGQRWKESTNCERRSDAAIVLDYKSGRTRVRAARENGQLRIGALAACRAYACVRARVGIVRLFPDGESWIDWADLDELEIDSIALEVGDLHRRVAEASKAFVERRELPKVVEGSHCDYCPAFTWCPAKTRLALQLAIAPQEIALEVAQLTDEQAGIALERMRAVRDLLDRVEDALKERARQAPIPLPNGNRYAQVEVQKEGLRAEAVYEVLSQLHGEDVARKAVEMKTSKSAVETVLKEIAKARKASGEKITAKAVVTEAMDAVRAVAGTYRYTSLQVREVRQARQEPPRTCGDCGGESEAEAHGDAFAAGDYESREP